MHRLSASSPWIAGLAALALTVPARGIEGQAATPTPTPAPAAPAPAAPKPPAFAMVKVNDDVFFRVGFLLQPQADFLQDLATRGYAQNYFVRRVRLLLGGQVAKNVTFFFETDTPNLGKVVGGVKQGATMTVQDAFLEWKVNDAFTLGAGLFLVPLSRNTLQSAAALLTIDYGSYSFLFSAPAGNVVGRDTGFHARGYFAKNHFEYRVGVFQGGRDTAGRQAPRFMARAMYNVFDVETGYFYVGTNLGKKKLLSIAGSFDAQKNYRAVAGDLFVDMPVPGGNAVTALANYIHYDGGLTFRTLPQQDTLHLEAGYYVGAAKVTPYGIFEVKEVADTDSGDEKRFGLGVSFFRNGHNFNVKAQYLRIDPRVGNNQNQFTIQLQGFYF